MKYEIHNGLDAELPLLFGGSTLSADHPKEDYLHWHDCIEIIYCEAGQGCVISGTNRISVEAGDIVIVNAGNIHDVLTRSRCTLYSIDLESELLAPFRLEPHLLVFREKIRDERIEAAMQRIIREMALQEEYYKQAVQTEIISMVITLMREYVDACAGRRLAETGQIQAVKKAISYLREHFLERITMDELCGSIGYSKFYLCHSFKKVTGNTVIWHVNFLKCQYARNLLLSGSYNVNESARLSGFTNDSYFTKTYKSIFGRLPSEELQT